MIKFIRYVLLIIHFSIGSVLGLLLGLLRPFNPSNSYWYTRIYAWFGLPLIGLKTKLIGKENFPTDRPFIVVANHQSNWDVLIVGGKIPKKMVTLGKKNLKWVPLFGQLFWLGGNVLIDRGNPKKAMEAMEITKKALTEDHINIWFFAEGTRNHGKNMLPFKKGAFVTAINAGVPIIRVCTSSYLEHLDLNKLKNGTAKIRILPPIETKDLTKKDLDTLMKHCHDSMSFVIQEMDENVKPLD